MQYSPVTRNYKPQPDSRMPVYIVIPAFVKSRLKTFERPLSDLLDFDVMSGILSPRELKIYLGNPLMNNKLIQEIVRTLQVPGMQQLDQFDPPEVPMTAAPKMLLALDPTDLMTKDRNKRSKVLEAVFYEQYADTQATDRFSYELKELKQIAGLAINATDDADNMDCYSFEIEHIQGNAWGLTFKLNTTPEQNWKYSVYRDAAERLFQRYGLRFVLKTGLVSWLLTRSQL